MNKSPKQLIILFLGRILQAVYALIAIRLATTLLGPAEIGRMNLVLGVTSWFALLLISPAGNFVFRQAIEWNTEGNLLPSLQRFTVLLAAISFLAVVVIVPLQHTIGIGTAISDWWLIWLVTASLLLGTLNLTFVTLLNMLGFRWWFVLFGNMTSWLGLGIAIGLGWWWAYVAEYWMTGLLLGQIVVTFLGGLVLYKLARAPSDLTATPTNTAGFDLKAVFGFAGPLIISTGFYWIQVHGYRFVLVNLTDETTIGLFTTGMSIAVTPLVMFDTFFNEYYRPIFYNDISYSNHIQKAQAWERYASAYFPAVVLTGTFVACSGPFLVRLLVSEAFYNIGWLTLWGALMQVGLMIYATYVTLVFASLDTRVLIAPSFWGALVTLVGTLALAQFDPLLGTAVALAIGMWITMISAALRLRHDFPIRLPWYRLGMAILLSIPLVIILEGALQFWPSPNLIQTLAVLALGGLYLLGAQLLLAREWLFRQTQVLTLSGTTKADAT